MKRVGGARDTTTSVICQSDLAPVAIYLPDATRAKREGGRERKNGRDYVKREYVRSKEE